MKLFGNKAVAFSLAYRAWQGSAGLLTIPLIAHFLSASTQGYYYTFASLVALQSFFELGLSIVISVFASHEWHKLRRTDDGGITGDPDARSRLTSLGRFVFAYFGVASLGYAVIAGCTGYFVLSTQPEAGVVWLTPWLLHIAFSALNLWLTPFLSLLEGCNQMARVATFRLVQSLVSNLALWIALSSGFELWSLPIFSAASLMMLLGFLAGAERRFFAVFKAHPTGPRLSWKSDLLPMQWRLAIQGLFGYLGFPLFTIITYLSLGAVEAGRMGMTLQIMTGIQQFALVFLIARAPEFALLAAAGQREELVTRCRLAAQRTGMAMLVLCLMVMGVLSTATEMGIPHAMRVLGLPAFAAFAAGIVLTTPVQAIALYLRAHKRELLTTVGVLSGLLYGVGAWLGSWQGGANGIALSYLLVTALVTLPLTFGVLRTHNAQPHGS